MTYSMNIKASSAHDFKMQSIELQPRELSIISSVVKKVWREIGVEAVRKTSGRINNIQAIEMCLDNCLPSRYCGYEGEQAEDIIDRRLRQYGWGSLSAFLKEKIQLIKPAEKSEEDSQENS